MLKNLALGYWPFYLNEVLGYVLLVLMLWLIDFNSDVEADQVDLDELTGVFPRSSGASFTETVST